MKKLLLTLLCTFGCTCLCLPCLSQDTTGNRMDKVLAAPDKLFTALNKKAADYEQKLDRQTEKYLCHLQKQEAKLKKKLWKKDSTLAKQLFDGVNDKYDRFKGLEGKVSGASSSVYSSHLDSLSTSLNFLQKANVSSLSNNPQLQKALVGYKSLQGKLNAAEGAKAFVAQRKALLKEQLGRLGMIKELKKYQKQAYYYSAQLKEYKQMWEDPDKLERKLLDIAQKIPKFREFFARNSQLGSLFSLPASQNPPLGGGGASLYGLQTRASVNQSIIDRFGSNANVQQQLQQNIQSAQGQLNELRNRISGFGSGSYGNGGDKDLPDFKPNSQKTRSFLNRLEYGCNLQSQKARYMFPSTSDLGFSAGYKLNDKSIVGIGASYKLGLGRGWDHIAISHQGVGLRSYVDYKIKGSLWLSGGYEQNYRSALQSVAFPSPFGGSRMGAAWQSSGLVGLSKKISAGKKVKTEVKLLWDFLSYRQIPRKQAILFRIGYNLK